jgi:hypothetical protein
MVDVLPSFNSKINYDRHYSMMEFPIIFASNEQDVNSALEKVYDVVSSGWSSSRLGQKETRANLLMYSPHDYRLYKCGEKFEN